MGLKNKMQYFESFTEERIEKKKNCNVKVLVHQIRLTEYLNVQVLSLMNHSNSNYIIPTVTLVKSIVICQVYRDKAQSIH